MTVMSTIAVLSAVMMPAIKGGKEAVNKYVATQGLHQMGLAMSAYVVDNDETFPPAFYAESGGLRSWYAYRDEKGNTDLTGGILYSYTKGKQLKDPSHHAAPYMGDGSGYGYNYATLGGDALHVSHGALVSSGHPATLSELETPGRMIAFATSSFYWPKWQKGDGQTHDFGFISPPSTWKGNSNIDFRHGGTKTVDEAKKKVESTGYALILTATGGQRMVKAGEITDTDFSRKEPESAEQK